MADVTSNVLQASTQHYDSGEQASSQQEAKQRSEAVISIVENLGSSLAQSRVIGEPEESIITQNFGVHVQKQQPTAYDGKLLGNGKVVAPATLSRALPTNAAAVSSKVTAWTGRGPLFWAAARSQWNSTSMQSDLLTVSFIDGLEGDTLNISDLDDPFVVTIGIGDTDMGANSSVYCSHWNTTSQLWVADGIVVNRSDSQLVCSFTHLTDFGGLFGPSNQLGSLDSLVSLDSWANNLLGFIICASLLGCSCLIVVWSLCEYLRSFKREGRTVQHEKQIRTRYGVSLVSLGSAKGRKGSWLKACFKIRTDTACVPIICRLRGDPFAPSQRLLLVFVTLIVGLFFNVLFYVQPSDPICVNSNGETICKSFDCPSCWSLIGDTSCDGGNLPSPMNVCSNWQSRNESNFTAHSACVSRPLLLCTDAAASIYKEPGRRPMFSGASGDVLGAAAPECETGTMTMLHAHYSETGKSVSSACVEWQEPTTFQTIMRALLAAACTAPVTLILEKLLGMLRKPTERALVGEMMRVDQISARNQKQRKGRVRTNRCCGCNWCCNKQQEVNDEVVVTDINKNTEMNVDQPVIKSKCCCCCQQTSARGSEQETGGWKKQEVQIDKRKRDKKKVHVPPAKLLELDHRKLNRKRPAVAAAAFCFAFVVGTASSVLIALVVVTFDEATTKAWLIGTLISVSTGWAQEPLKAMALAYAMGCFHKCRKKEKIGIKQVAMMVRAQANFDRPKTPVNPFQPPNDFGSMLEKGPQRIKLAIYLFIYLFICLFVIGPQRIKLARLTGRVLEPYDRPPDMLLIT